MALIATPVLVWAPLDVNSADRYARCLGDTSSISRTRTLAGSSPRCQTSHILHEFRLAECYGPITHQSLAGVTNVGRNVGEVAGGVDERCNAAHGRECHPVAIYPQFGRMYRVFRSDLGRDQWPRNSVAVCAGSAVVWRWGLVVARYMLHGGAAEDSYA